MLISFSHLIHDTYSSFLAPLLPLLIDKFSLSYSMASLLGLLQRLPNLVSPFLGLLADRMGMRWLVIISPALTAIAMSLIGLAPTFTVIAILLLVTGISSALFHVPTPVMVSKVSGEEIGRGMSWYMFGGEIARTIGPLMVLGAISLWGLEGTWKLIPLGLAASGLLYYKLRKITISDEFRNKSDIMGLRKTFRQSMPFFILLVGLTFFRSIMRAALTTFLPTYMTLKGESLWTGGVFLSVLELSGAAGTLFWGYYSDRIGRRKALSIIVYTAPVLMFLFSVIDGWAALPVLAILGFFLLGTTPILLALTQDRGTERPAFFNSMFLTVSFGSEAAALMIAGIMADWVGLETTFNLSAVIALGAIPFVFMIKRP
ncbi:MAG: MFS transporter [Bacteroidales bacterium]|nr:MFS transporter [Bacteroidales bacterium]